MHYPFRLSSLVLLLVLGSCQSPSEPKESHISSVEIDTLPYEITGYSYDRRLKEVSGMVKSLRFPGDFWVHNDSGDDPVIYRVNDSLQIVQEVFIEDAGHFDWEDISISEYQGESYLFIGDIGDNLAVRDSVSIYLVKEPLADMTSIAIEKRISLTYEDGPRDAELLLFDQGLNEIVIVTKRDIPSRVYSYTIANQDNTANLIFEGELNLPQDDGLEAKDLFRITAGDSSLKGDIILKNYHRVYYFAPQSVFSVKEQLINVLPVRLEYERELQGEAIALDENGYWVTSECADDGKQHIPQPLYFYQGYTPINDR